MLNAAIPVENEAVFTSQAVAKPWPLSSASELKVVVAIVIGQIAILLGMIVLDGLPLALGERVKLQVMPVDPRDMFRGDYVVLNYEFSQFDPTSVGGAARADWRRPYDDDSLGKDVYVSLRPEGDHHVAGARSLKPPSSGSYIHGRVQNGWNPRLDCGIEAYYLQEGEGKRIENLIRQKRILAEVAIWRGHAKLVRLIE